MSRLQLTKQSSINHHQLPEEKSFKLKAVWVITCNIWWSGLSRLRRNLVIESNGTQGVLRGMISELNRSPLFG